MKRFKIEGWYRFYDEKDFNAMVTTRFDAKEAVAYFCMYYDELHFYKITVEEIL